MLKYFFLCLIMFSHGLSELMAKPPVKKKVQINWNQDTTFKDGLYLNWTEMAQKSPGAPMHLVKIKTLDSNQFHLPSVTKIWIKNKKGYKRIPIKKVWGICYKGKSYINYQLRNNTKKSDLAPYDKALEDKTISFYRIIITGRYSVFVAEGIKGSYNTNTQINKPVQPDNAFVKRMMIDMATGKIMAFNVANVLKVIKDDPYVTEQYFDNPLIENLDKVIILYNERHPVWEL